MRGVGLHAGERVDKTLRKLSRPGSGVSKRDPKELERVADAVSNGRSDVRRLAEHAGERGGEQMLNREGHHIPEAFHSVQPPPHAAPARATWTAWPSHPAGTRSSSPSTRAAPPPTTRARPTLLMSSMSSEPRPRPRARPTMSWTACWRTSASPVLPRQPRPAGVHQGRPYQPAHGRLRDPRPRADHQGPHHGLLALTRLHCQARAEDRRSLSTQPHIKHPRERIIP